MTTHLFHRIFTLSFISCVLTAALFAQPELDISFNATGKAKVDFTNGQDAAYEVLVQADNKIVAIGTTAISSSPRHFALTRFNTNGSLDTSFGDNGRVITVFNASSAVEGALAAAIQPDGKIIAAGYVNRFTPGEGYFALARYNTDGSLDTAFGNGGKVLTSIVQHINEARAIAVGQDGKIVVSGYYFGGNQNFQTLVARYNPDGSLDSSFGSGGTVTDFRGFTLGDINLAQAVAVQPDGQIVIAGYFRSNSDGATSATIARINVNGTFDNSFGGSGRVEIAGAPGYSFTDVEILPDGRILAGGTAGGEFFLMRLHPWGSPDQTFDGDGRVTTPMGGNSLITGLTVRPNGKILVSGSIGDQGCGAAYYNAGGSLDTSFSGDGRLTFNFDEINSGCNGMAFDGLNRPVLGGYSGAFNSGSFAVARLYTVEPTPVTVTAQTVTAEGTPLRNIRVGFTDAAGQTRWAITSAFGFVVFDNVPTGQTYTLFVRGSKHYTFETRTFGLNEAVDNLTLIGTPIEHRPGRDNPVLNERKGISTRAVFEGKKY